MSATLITEAEIARLRCNDLDALAPKFRERVEAAVDECWQNGLDAYVFETLRCRELAELYHARGTSKAPNELYSWHGYGLAVDVISKKDGWDPPEGWFRKVADIFRKHGCDWGGDWKTFKDLPHFQLGGLKASPSEKARTILREAGMRGVWKNVGAA